MRMAAGTGRARLGRGEWVREGLRVLAEEGIEAVRVEPLSKRLGVTKGSFYHHFGDRDDLLTALLDAWHARATSLVIELVNQHSKRPEERIRRLLEMTIDAEVREAFGLVDLGIRDWARRDRRARSMLESVDAERQAYIAERFRVLGCGPSDARFRAFLVYAYILGEAQILTSSSQSARVERVDRCVGLMVQDLPEAGSVVEPAA